MTAPFDGLIQAKPAALNGDPLAGVLLAAGGLFSSAVLEVNAFLEFPGMVTMCGMQV